MNKLEVFLDKLTENSEVYCDTYSLAFFLENDLQVMFTKDDNSSSCFLDIIWAKDISYETKFAFVLPVSNILDFLEKYTHQENFQKHFLTQIKVPLSNNIDGVYTGLIHALDTCEHAQIKSKAFQTRLENALKKKESSLKKIKI